MKNGANVANVTNVVNVSRCFGAFVNICKLHVKKLVVLLTMLAVLLNSDGFLS